MDKIKSRKFIISIVVLVYSSLAPILYKFMGISDVVALAAMGIVASVGVSYSVVNVKDAKNKMMANTPQPPDIEVNNTEIKVG